MKKLATRFLVLSSLCICLVVLSSNSLASNDNARPGSCKPICVAEGIECFQRWNYADKICEISRCFTDSQNCRDILIDN